MINDKVFGIVSYLPDKEPERGERKARLERLFARLAELWPGVPALVIAQNWQGFRPGFEPLILTERPKLGILGARKELRREFLASSFNWLIMMDDDCIVDCDSPSAPTDYMKALDEHQGGFAFVKGKGEGGLPYADSQLNLCAIHRLVYERMDMPDVDPQRSEGFEDRIFATSLHVLLPLSEFDLPSSIRHSHFKNLKEPLPSTWSRTAGLDWQRLRQGTLKIEKAIRDFHRRLDCALVAGRYASADGRTYMQISGNCSDIGYLGDGRPRGPVDNVVCKGAECLRLVLSGGYAEAVAGATPEVSPRRPSYAGDHTSAYGYGFVDVLHDDPTTEAYKAELRRRQLTLDTAVLMAKSDPAFWLTMNLHSYEVDQDSHSLIGDRLEEELKTLRDFGVAAKTIVVGLRRESNKGAADWHAAKAVDLIRRYGAKYVEIVDNRLHDPATAKQFLAKADKAIRGLGAAHVERAKEPARGKANHPGWKIG